MRYDALLLDFDGVVVNVLPDDRRLPAFRERIAEELSARHTTALDGAEETVETLAHSVTPTQLTHLSAQTGIPEGELWQARDDAIADVLDQAARAGHKTPFADAPALTTVTEPIGIVSNNQQRVVESISDHFDLTEQFGAIRARDPRPESLANKKPEPTFLEETIRDLGVENPLFVGDKETDIRAGKRAGVDTALLRRDHNADRAINLTPTYERESLDAIVELL